MTRFSRGSQGMGSRIALAVIVAIVAFIVRLQAVSHLPVDYDEPIYLRGAQAYAEGFRTGKLAVVFEDDSPENPPLMKLVFGLALVSQPAQLPVTTDLNQPLPEHLVSAARIASSAFGALAVLLLSLVSPLAGLALAVHTLHIKYTSEVVLEALPFASSLLCVVAYQRSHGRLNGWLIVSAAALGVTAASKYLYCVVAIAILIEWTARLARSQDKGRDVRDALIWGAAAVAVFVLANPYLWPDPFGRLIASLTFHRQNSSLAVNTGKYPPWQPLVWLATPSSFRPDVFFVWLDSIILILAAFGVPVLWRQQRVFSFWFALGLVFLLIYSNRWPQYPLIILAPLCLSAALGLRALLQRPTVAWFKRNAVGLGLAGATVVWSVWLGHNWHQADPAFREAVALMQSRLKQDEVALFAAANPSLEVASALPGRPGWDWTSSRLLGQGQVTADHAVASRWLNETLEGRTGVWLLTYQAGVADPADTLRSLMQRQAHLLSPSFTNTFARGYELTHYEFDAPYQSTPSLGVFDSAAVDPGYGKSVGLSSDGCAQLRPAYAGEMLEVMCLWRTSPFAPLAWDTQVSLRLHDAQGNPVAQSDQLIARSGFPTTRYEGIITGNYFMPLPPRLEPGRYTLRAFVYGSDGEYAPLVTADVALSPAPVQPLP